jgi:hypothetical protein
MYKLKLNFYFHFFFVHSSHHLGELCWPHQFLMKAHSPKKKDNVNLTTSL